MRKLTVFIVFIIICHFSLAQEIKFDHLSTDHGLSTGTVNATWRDSHGFLWVGTIDGLNKYDGYNVEIYRFDKTDPNSLVNNNVSDIIEFNKEIWVGTSNGISIYNPQSNSFSNLNPASNYTEIDDTIIKELFIDSQNNLWVASRRNGLFRYIPKTKAFKKYSNNGFSTNSIIALAELESGILVLSGNSGAIDFFNIELEKVTKKVTYDPNYPQGKVENHRPLFIDKRGLIWVGTENNGFYIVDPNTNEITNLRKENSKLSMNIVT